MANLLALSIWDWGGEAMKLCIFSTNSYTNLASGFDKKSIKHSCGLTVLKEKLSQIGFQDKLTIRGYY